MKERKYVPKKGTMGVYPFNFVYEYEHFIIIGQLSGRTPLIDQIKCSLIIVYAIYSYKKTRKTHLTFSLNLLSLLALLQLFDEFQTC